MKIKFTNTMIILVFTVLFIFAASKGRESYQGFATSEASCQELVNSELAKSIPTCTQKCFSNTEKTQWYAEILTDSDAVCSKVSQGYTCNAAVGCNGTTTGKTCSDSDSSNYPTFNYNVSGVMTATINGQAYFDDGRPIGGIDTCINSNTLKEYACISQTTWTSVEVSCACVDGKCTTKPEGIPSTTPTESKLVSSIEISDLKQITTKDMNLYACSSTADCKDGECKTLAYLREKNYIDESKVTQFFDDWKLRAPTAAVTGVLGAAGGTAACSAILGLFGVATGGATWVALPVCGIAGGAAGASIGDGALDVLKGIFQQDESKVGLCVTGSGSFLDNLPILIDDPTLNLIVWLFIAMMFLMLISNMFK